MALKLNPCLLNRAVRVIVIGAGGTGSQVLYGLAQLDMAMRALGHPHGLSVTVQDGDTVSHSNIGRQLFFPADVGANKAMVLTHRINLTFGTQWEADPGMANRSKLNRVSPDIVITCVDNRKARALVHDYFCSMNAHAGLYWLDFGNKVSSGQAIIGYAEDRKVLVPSSAELFPEIADPTVVDDDDGPSCSLADALAKQSLFVNRTLASHGLNMLWELFRHAQVDHHGIFMNLKSGRVTPLRVDANEWQRFGWPPAPKPRTRKRATKATKAAQ